MSADEKELGVSPQVPGPFESVQATPAATQTATEKRVDDGWHYDQRRHPSLAWRLA